MKIIFCGSQGTGKTTVLNRFRNEGWNVITEVVRILAREEGVKINELGDEEGQLKIFNKYKELLNTQKDYISDRGMPDVIAYTHYLVSEGKVHPSVLWNQLDDLTYFIDSNNPLICYFPIEFPVVNDGLRSTDEEFRSTIDSNIKSILDNEKIPYITVKGTVDERVNMIKQAIKDKYDVDVN